MNVDNNINKENQIQIDTEIIDLNSNSNQENKKSVNSKNNINHSNNNEEKSKIKTIQVNLINTKNNDNIKTSDNINEAINKDINKKIMSTENIKTNESNPQKENIGGNITPIIKKEIKNINSNNDQDINIIQTNDLGKYSVSLGGLNSDMEQEKEIEFVKDKGYLIRMQICGLRVRMGHFVSERKAISVIKYLKINQNIIASMPLEIRKEWLKNLVMMIEELLD